MMQTFNKYAKVGAVAPSKVQSAAAASQSGSVSASPEQYDSSYLCPVNVGGTTMMLDFDTGSADLFVPPPFDHIHHLNADNTICSWVFSNQLSSSTTAGHAIYKPSSTGKKLNGYTWAISYGDNSGASGNVYADKVVVGGVTATSQAVEAANSVSAEFSQDRDNDGLLGLAFSSINTVQPQRQTTFFDTVKSTLAKPLFTVDLKAGKPGTYDFGYIDSSKYTGAITYVPVDSSQGFWSFKAGAYSTGSATPKSSVGSAIMDTGTSLVLLPSAVVTEYYSHVSGASFDNDQGGYTFPCSKTLPDWNMVIGSTKFTVPGSYINYAPIDSDGETCYGGLQPNTGLGLTIIGDVFMKATFVVFDQSTGSPRLGVAAQS
jgi:aspergillopepsin I